MLSYKRFVAYIYEYQENSKGKNKGYVKVEVKNGHCYMNYHLRNLDVAKEKMKVYGFIRENDELRGVFLSLAPVNEHNLDFAMDMSPISIGNTVYGLEELSGIVILGETSKYGTQWDDKPINFSGFEIIELKQKDEVELDDENNARMWQEIGDTSKASDVQLSTHLQGDNGGNGQELSMDRGEVEGACSAIKPGAVEVNSEYACGEGNQELSEPKLAAALNLDGDQVTREELESQEVKEKVKRQQMYTRVHKEELHKMAEKWKDLLEEFPRLEPFEDGGLVECIKITPSDLTRLQRQDWVLGNNSFLLHGYYNYHYLILGKIEGRDCYVLGVPGIFDHQERFMATMFGFPNFKAEKDSKLKMGQFGYWYRPIY